MNEARDSIDAMTLAVRIGTAGAPRLLDVRRREAFENDARMAATAIRVDPELVAVPATPCDAEIVVYCVHGHQVSRAAAARLLAAGCDARFVEGGFAAIVEAGGATMARCDRTPPGWAIATRPRLGELGAAWIAHRLIAPHAPLHALEREWLAATCAELGAQPLAETPECRAPARELAARHGVDAPGLAAFLDAIETNAALANVVEHLPSTGRKHRDWIGAAFAMLDALYASCRAAPAARAA